MDKRKWIPAAVSLICSALCILLYFCDNKYTVDSMQPISGILLYEDDGDAVPLIREWMIYPNVLLTPETADTYTGYRCYGDIGGEREYTGDITYCMTLVLPEEPEIYAVEITEIFSSCRVYVNDTCILSLGSQGTDGYAEGIACRPAVFEASGITELMITASDRSGINSGMTYPPMFGKAGDVAAVRELRLLVHSGTMLLCLIGAFLSLVLNTSGKQKVLNVLLCLAAAVQTGYPLYHGIFVTPAQPLYTIEPLCSCGILLLSVILCCSVCGIRGYRRLLFLLPGLCGVLFTLIRFGLAAFLPYTVSEVFSVTVSILKYVTSAILVYLAISKPAPESSAILLAGTFANAVCLIWDRLLPLYEPVAGVWFNELGSFLLAASAAAVLWMDAAEAYRFRLTYRDGLLRMEQRLAMQKEHYTQLSAQVRLAREASHDLRHHLRVLSGFAETQNWPALQNYLEEYTSHLQSREVHVWSDHGTADAILSYYAGECKKIGAIYDVRFSVPSDLAFPDNELCIVLGNLLENAVEAMKVQKHGLKKLYLRGECYDGYLRIVLDNTFSGIIEKKNGIFLSTRHSGYGLGLSSVLTIAEQHGGLADFTDCDGIFRSSVLLPLAWEYSAGE